jgi:hypothetical protein
MKRIGKAYEEEKGTCWVRDAASCRGYGKELEPIQTTGMVSQLYIA